MNENIASTRSWYQRHLERAALRDHIATEIFKSRPDSQWCDVTFTMKKGIVIDGTFHRLDYGKAHRAVKELLNRLNRRVYKKSYRRFGKHLACVPVVETGKCGEERMHIHMLLEVPEYMEQDPHGFLDIVLQEWKKCPWSYKKNVLHLLKSDEDVTGWLKYILKDYSANDGILDPANVHYGSPLSDKDKNLKIH
jgi:hypothetical protein